MDVADKRIREQALYFARYLPSPGTEFFEPDVFFVRAQKLLEFEVQRILQARGIHERTHSKAIHRLSGLNLDKDDKLLCRWLHSIRRIRNSAAHDFKLKLSVRRDWRRLINEFFQYQGRNEPMELNIEELDAQTEMATYLCVVQIWAHLCRLAGAPIEFDPVKEIAAAVKAKHEELDGDA